MLIDEPAEGYFQLRLRKAGSWVPVRVWLEDGERDPDTWELLSDQVWKGEWAPRTDSPSLYPTNPMRFVNRLQPISKVDFQWLLILRTMRFRRASQKRSSK